jgi:hypothetical protein
MSSPFYSFSNVCRSAEKKELLTRELQFPPTICDPLNYVNTAKVFIFHMTKSITTSSTKLLAFMFLSPRAPQHLTSIHRGLRFGEKEISHKTLSMAHMKRREKFIEGPRQHIRDVFLFVPIHQIRLAAE